MVGDAKKVCAKLYEPRVAVGGKGPDTANADRWAITIRFEDEHFWCRMTIC